MGSKSFFYVLAATSLHIAFISTGWFDEVTTELGYEMYAEEVDSIPWIPAQYKFPMPMNTLINLGYALAGFAWLNTFGEVKDFWGESFCWYSIIYSMIQAARIVYQTQRTAVLDQWITTTIFCHVTVWLADLPTDGSVARCVNAIGRKKILLISFLSYFMSIWCEIGFDIALVVHMLIAILAGYEAHQAYGDDTTATIFKKAFLCSLGFVVLKIADLPLKEYWYPNCISGHFLSKVCDVGQIYYAANFAFLVNGNHFKSRVKEVSATVASWLGAE